MAQLKEGSIIKKSTGDEVIATVNDLDDKNSLKADKTYVDSQDALKADKTYVDSLVGDINSVLQGVIDGE